MGSVHAGPSDRVGWQVFGLVTGTVVLVVTRGDEIGRDVGRADIGCVRWCWFLVGCYGRVMGEMCVLWLG